ncbi:MAG: hypothetical protein JOZ54_11240, partial [Acidobacteria bacterium]|nr:hypothetical protein [Acidobacteriota bacterium]
MSYLRQSRPLFFLLALVVLSLPALADNVTLSGTVDFATIDGSAQDHDHAHNGVFTVNDGNLTINGTVNCNDTLFSGACDMKFVVSGNFTMNAGSVLSAEDRLGTGNGGDVTVQANGTIAMNGPSGSLAGARISTSRSIGALPGQHAGAVTFTSGGATTLSAGSVISAAAGDGSAGNISLTAGNAITVGGLVASGPSATLRSGGKYSGALFTGGLPTMTGGNITIKSTSHSEPAVILTGDAVVGSQGGLGGGGTVTLEGCNVQIKGIVAAISSNGVNNKVVVRSGTSVTVDGRDVNRSGVTAGRNGVIRTDSTFQSTAQTAIDIFARNDITVFGPEAAVTSAYGVNANAGTLVHNVSGVIRVISTSGKVTANGNAFTASGTNLGDQGGTINLSAKDNVTLDGASIKAFGDTGLDPFRRGGHITVRSHSGA